MTNGQATAVLTYHRTESADAFSEFAERLNVDARAAPGFRSWQHSVLESPELDWSIALTFHDEAALHDWLDRAGERLDDGVHRHSRVDLITDGAPRTEGVLLVREAIKSGRDADYVAASERLVALERSMPGYEGASLFPAFEGIDGTEPWSHVVRFRTAKHLQACLDSPAFAQALPDLEQHVVDGAPVTATTAFSTLRVTDDGETLVTPTWKTYLMVLLVLYPTAVVQGALVDPLIRGVATVPWLAGLLSMLLNVALLVWLMMPLGARVLRKWMDPVDGAGARVTLLGVLGIAAAFAAYFAVFLAVGFLRTS